MIKRPPWTGLSADTFENILIGMADDPRIKDLLIRGEVLSFYCVRGKKGKGTPFRLKKAGYYLPVRNKSAIEGV